MFYILQNFYAERFGPDNMVIIKDSNVVDPNNLDPDKAYIQITYVEPYFEPYEYRYRLTHFDRNFNISKYQFIKLILLEYHLVEIIEFIIFRVFLFIGLQGTIWIIQPYIYIDCSNIYHQGPDPTVVVDKLKYTQRLDLCSKPAIVQRFSYGSLVIAAPLELPYLLWIKIC